MRRIIPAVLSLILFICSLPTAFAEPVNYMLGDSLPLSGGPAEFGEDVCCGQNIMRRYNHALRLPIALRLQMIACPLCLPAARDKTHP